MRLPEITPVVMGIISDLVNSINHGTVILVIQDGRLLQLERHDKIRLDTEDKALRAALKQHQIERLQTKLQDEMKDLQFGQVILNVKNGIIVQIERTVKHRSFGLEGIYGDGI